MLKTAWTPWDTYSDLTLERLTIVALILARERDDAAHDHRPEKGETEFTLGCGAWERTKYALILATQQYSWLSVVSGSEPGPSPFVFQIGVYLVRFYHGKPELAPQRYLLLSDPEQAMLPLNDVLPPDHFLRISIETDVLHLTSNVELVEYDQFKEVVQKFSIPLTEQVQTISRFVAPQKAGVEIPAPRVEVLQRERKQQGE